MKSGNLNFLEPSGSFQACKGTAVPLPLPILTYYITNIRSECDVRFEQGTIWSRGWLTVVWEDPFQGCSEDADSAFVITASHARKTSKFLDLGPTTPKHEMFYHFKSHLSM